MAAHQLKKVLLGTIGLLTLGFAGPAVAADLPARTYTKAPAMIAAIYDWSGFYIGINGGGGWSRKCWDITNNAGAVVTPAAAEGCNTGSGGLVGGQAGYRWQSGAWVFGVEGQGDWANLKGSNSSLFFAPAGVATNQSKVNALGLLTGQVGYAWNNALWYVKGGAAVAADKYTGLTTATGVPFDQASETRWGGAVGTGLEFGFASSWSAAVEYDHAFLGSRTNTFLATGATAPVGTLSRTDNVRQDVDMVTARINYRWGGPVVAKY